MLTPLILFEVDNAAQVIRGVNGHIPLGYRAPFGHITKEGLGQGDKCIYVNELFTHIQNSENLQEINLEHWP